MAIKWTDEQRHCFEARGGSILVSAAAGSGKTAVLVKRIIDLITDPDHPVNVDQLLIVTFTRAAAAEMRQRLSDRLAELMVEDPANQNYALQQMLLPRAYISTIDGFCARFLQEFAPQSSLPTGFRVAEEGQAAMLRSEALDTVLDRRYRAKSPEFLRLAEQLCNDKGDEDLRSAITSAYTFMQAQPFPDRWLQDQVDAYTEDIPLEQTRWMKPILEKADSFVLWAKDMSRVLKQMAIELNLVPYVDNVQTDINRLEQLHNDLPTMSYQDVYQTFHPFKLTPLTPIRGSDEVEKAKKKYFSDIRKQITEQSKKIKNVLNCDEAQCKADLQQMTPYVQELSRLVQDFTQEYVNLKRQQKLVDYNDLEHETLRLLVDADTNRPTPLAQQLSRRFVEIMVDECQDCNKAQDTLFTALARPEGNLFMVGDVKQSIYVFRQAMPEIFTQRRDSYTPYREQEGVFPASITLGNNFRSREDVTESVNFLFRQLMTRRLGGVEYDDQEQLRFSASYPTDGTDYNTEWLLLDKKADETISEVQHEARQIGCRIQQLVGRMRVLKSKEEKARVDDDGKDDRPLEYRDVCILMRKRDAMPTFVKEMGAMGIPVAADKGENFLSTPEVSAAVSLLRAIDNPLREVALSAAMLSPIYGFTPDDMTQVRILSDKYLPLYAAVEQVSKNEEYPVLARRLTALLEDLRRFRALAVSLPADRLLETVYRETSIEAVYSARAGGRQRVANLRQLDRVARSYEKGEFRGLSSFVRYIDRMEESGKSLDGGSTLSQNGVRLMTIHGSKGLEFPVVIVARLCNERGTKDSRTKILFHAEAGIGMQLVDRDSYEKHLPLPFQGVLEARRLSDISEDLRVQYVALTRAREKLIMVYSMNSPEQKLAKMQNNVMLDERLPMFSVLHASCPGEMLLMASLRHRDCIPLRRGRSLDSLPCSRSWLVHAFPQWEPTVATMAERSEAAVDEPLKKEFQRRLAQSYPYAPLFGVPAKLAASQLSHRESQRHHIATSRPAFLQADGMTAAQKGTAHHAFMQYADYAAAYRNLEGEIARVTEAGFLTPQQAEVLDTDRLFAFFKSPLYRRMASAEQTWREYPFAVTVAAGSITDLPAAVASEQVLVQGIADCVFREGAGLVLVDYKTDKVDSGAELVERYRSQMQFYRQALEQLLGLPVAETYLYSFHLCEAVAVN